MHKAPKHTDLSPPFSGVCITLLCQVVGDRGCEGVTGRCNQQRDWTQRYQRPVGHRRHFDDARQTASSHRTARGRDWRLSWAHWRPPAAAWRTRSTDRQSATHGPHRLKPQIRSRIHQRIEFCCFHTWRSRIKLLTIDRICLGRVWIQAKMSTPSGLSAEFIIISVKL